MPRFMVTRTLPPLSSEQLNTVGKNVVAACDQLGMQWIGSHVTADGKHSFCEFEAPNAETCREHAKLAELPVDDVIPLGIQIGPAQFK
ncbi:MAG TPA: DUF4242 domain-containing protein [Pyrinomonadaceae bacterium]|nr:DUF4242 domain-containing protein [Pyrinomonadaceae bacterium]